MAFAQSLIMKKIYVYADESGQHTLGEIFVVAVIVIAEDVRERVTAYCEQCENQSQKGKVKYSRVKHRQRMRYLQAIFSHEQFKGRLKFALFRDTKAYDAKIGDAIAHAVQPVPDDKHTHCVHRCSR